MRRVGVLALQGGYDPHLRMLGDLEGVDAHAVRDLAGLSSVEALILPGGESTTIGKLLVIQGLLEPLRKRIAEGMPVFGTCAGMILLARDVQGREQTLLGALDITVERNAYGRQTESFETLLKPEPGRDRLADDQPGVFIRAPRVSRWGSSVDVLIRYENSPVLVRDRHILAASFHPELTSSSDLHRYFLGMI